MNKQSNAGAAPVSKYAAKKRLNVVNANANVANANANVSQNDANDSEEETGAIDDKFRGLPPVVKNFPEHVVQLALIIKNNAEIRRFTALGILNYLLQKGEISGDKRYVSFKWNKFAVKANGLMREYPYTEPFFINALVAAFTSFSASAQVTIDNFCHKEMSVGIDKAVDQEEVNEILGMTTSKSNDED